MTINTEFKHLEKENDEIRAKINSFILNNIPLIEQEKLINLINNLIENELLQEELCNR